MDTKTIINDPYTSEDTREYHKAFALMQSEYTTIGGNRENPGFKSTYADKEIILEMIQPLLKKHEFSLTCKEYLCPVVGPHLRTRLTHTKSGQWEESRSKLDPAKPGDQEYGKTLTYRSRYSIVNLLCLRISKDPADNDGYDEKSHSPKPEPRDPYIAFAQVDKLETLLKDLPDTKEIVLDYFKIKDFYHLPKEKYKECLEAIKEPT